jgi:hypothetical protein
MRSGGGGANEMAGRGRSSSRRKSGENFVSEIEEEE